MSGTARTDDVAVRWPVWLRQNSIVLVFAVVVLLATLVSDGRFIRPQNIINVLFQSSVVGVLALGETLVMLTGGIDLSVVATAILAAIVMGAAGSEQQQEMSLSGVLPYLGLPLSVLVAFAAALIIGLLNGAMVVVLRIPAFIATLAMALLVSGTAMLLTGGAPIYYPAQFFTALGQMKLLWLPFPVHAFLVVASVLSLVLSRTKLGVMLYALGGNARAARLSGIPVGTVMICVHTLCSLLAGVAGFLFLARTGFVAPTSGENFLLTTIAAVVVGGISLAGGKGSIKGAVVGVLLLASLSNLMNILLISPHLQDAVSGIIILAAIMVNVRIDPG